MIADRLPKMYDKPGFLEDCDETTEECDDVSEIDAKLHEVRYQVFISVARWESIIRRIDPEQLREIYRRLEDLKRGFAEMHLGLADLAQTERQGTTVVDPETLIDNVVFLAELYSLSHSESERKAVGIIYKFVHPRLIDGSIGEIDALLRDVDEKILLPSSTIALLMATLPLASQLPSRHRFGKMAAKWAKGKWGREISKEIAHYI